MKQNQNASVYAEEPFGVRARRFVFRWILRILVLLLVACGLFYWGVREHLETILTGPSTAARDQLALYLFEDSKTSWIPGKFMRSEDIAALGSMVGHPEIETRPVEEDYPAEMEIPQEDPFAEWDGHPDGIRIEKIAGETYQAYAMLIQDPSRVYLGLSNKKLSSKVPGKRMNEAMEELDAVAAINSGAFFDNGTSDPEVGATPQGLVISEGKSAWKTGTPPSRGFAGFTEDNRLYVAAKNISEKEAQELGIRDGCCFGPALIINGTVNEKAKDQLPGRQPRTAIGQRKDGTVIFLCVDGRQASSVGANIQDVVDLMVQLGAVNACNMDGGSSTVMMYRDTHGLYGESDKLYMVNSYSQLQPAPRRMPDYWMVRSDKED